MNSAKINAFLREDAPKKDTTYPIYIRVSIGKSKKVYSLGISISKKFWDNTHQVILPGPANFVNSNSIIRDAKNKAWDLIARATLDGKTLTLEDFEDLFKPEKYNKVSFIAFWENELIRDKISQSDDTYRTNKSQLTKLKEFKKELSFKEIHHVFWKNYEAWLIQKGNTSNTRHKAFRTVRAYLNRAVKAGLITENPLQGIKVKQTLAKRENLTIAEVKRLNDLLKPDVQKITKMQRTILETFIFSCYTGLRFRDVHDLKHENIIDKNRLRVKIHKNENYLEIPLIDEALKFIKQGLPKNNVFRVYCNQVTNRELKHIMKVAQIDKNISFHCARHTFATICLSDAEMPLSVVQALLGHRSIKDTQIYAKIRDMAKEKSMQRLDELFA